MDKTFLKMTSFPKFQNLAIKQKSSPIEIKEKMRKVIAIKYYITEFRKYSLHVNNEIQAKFLS